MKCPKCGTETIIANAGVLTSIPYDYCPKCKEEVIDSDLTLEEFFLDDDDDPDLNISQYWNYSNSPHNFNYNNAYNIETVYSTKLLYNNVCGMSDVVVEVVNDSTDQLEVRLEDSGSYFVKWPEFLSAKGTHKDTEKFVVGVGKKLIASATKPPQDLKWRTI